MKTKQMTALIVVLSLLTQSLSGLTASGGGGAEGHGGLSVVCRDANLKVSSIQLLDLFEGESQMIPPLVFDRSDVKDFAVQAAEKLERLSLIDREIYQQSREELREILSRYQILPDGKGLTPTGDAQSLVRQKGCNFEQLASFGHDQYLRIDRELLQAMEAQKGGQTEKAALFVHEVLYKIARKMVNARNSDWVRPIIALLFSENVDATRLKNAFEQVFGSPYAETGKTVVVRMDKQKKKEPITMEVTLASGEGKFQLKGASMILGLAERTGTLASYSPANFKIANTAYSALDWNFMALTVSVQPTEFKIQVRQGEQLIHEEVIRYRLHRESGGKVENVYALGLVFRWGNTPPVANNVGSQEKNPKTPATPEESLGKSESSTGDAAASPELSELKEKGAEPGIFTKMGRGMMSGVKSAAEFVFVDIPRGIWTGVKYTIPFVMWYMVAPVLFVKSAVEAATGNEDVGALSGVFLGGVPPVAVFFLVPGGAALGAFVVLGTWIGGTVSMNCKTDDSDYCMNVNITHDEIADSTRNAGHSVGNGIRNFFKSIGEFFSPSPKEGQTKPAK